MRVITSLFTSLLVIAVIAGVGFVVVREVLLQVALSQLKSDAGQLQRIARNTGGYIQECLQKGSNSLDDQIIQDIQLRFTSSTEYQLEVICSQHTLDPIVIESHQLPMFVQKAAGSSGLKWQLDPTAVAVTLWGRTRSLGIREETIVDGLSPVDVGIAFAPATSCTGYGFTCCQAETSIGKGEPIAAATDCPRSCFTSCSARPVILSLTTQPFLDQVTRTVQLGKGEELSIGYVMDASGLDAVTTVVDFGDGEQASFTEINGLTSHTYSCLQPSCQYQLSVVATASNGASSADTPVTKLTVLVQ